MHSKFLSDPFYSFFFFLWKFLEQYCVSKKWDQTEDSSYLSDKYYEKLKIMHTNLISSINSLTIIDLACERLHACLSHKLNQLVF